MLTLSAPASNTAAASSADRTPPPTVNGTNSVAAVRFTVSISDRPGGLARLAELIASTGASIQEIVHDRAFSGPDLTAVRVVCVVETTGHAHVRELHAALEAAGMQVGV